jgi:ubiquinone/menaquinone biosynthesis C-methylase UbiE
VPFPTRFVRSVYDRRAAGFDRFVEIASLGLDRTLRARYARGMGPVVLDVGCGTGRDTAAVDGTFVGVDLSRGMLSRAPRGPRLHYIQADAAYLPIKRADAVLCTYTLSTVADWRGALAEMLRALRPGGRLVVTEDRLPPGWFLGPGPMLRHFFRFGWGAIDGALWKSITGAMARCRRGSALFGLLYWMEGTKLRKEVPCRPD